MTLDDYKRKLKTSRAHEESYYWTTLKRKLRHDFPMPADRIYCVMCCRKALANLPGKVPVCAWHDGYIALRSCRAKFQLELRRVQLELKNKARRARALRDGPRRGGWYVAPCGTKKKKPVTRAEFENLLNRLIKLENQFAVVESRVGHLVTAVTGVRG